MKLILSILLLSLAANSFGQNLEPYNAEFKFQVVTGNNALKADSTVEAIIIVCDSVSIKNAYHSVEENLQIKELKLINPDQMLINEFASLELKNLHYLFIDAYRHESLQISKFPNVEVFSVTSERLEKLDMVGAQFQKLAVLGVHAVELREWTSDSALPSLELLDIMAPHLDSLPILLMPQLYEFVFFCSFTSMPKDLCKYEELSLMSFNNFTAIPVDDCIIEKIKSGVYSNLTVFESISGKELLKVVSNDRKE